jgi:uncharacterized membrane protein YfcA
MDGTVLGLYLLSTFFGGMVSGFAGFALGLVVAGVWLHFLTPAQTAILMVGYGLVTQAYGIWKLRHVLHWQRVWPFIVGGAVGVPIGTALLAYANPNALRVGIGVLLIVYSLYGLVRPAIKLTSPGLAAHAGVGVLNGILGGLTGLAGVIVAVWCQLQDWPKDMQRAVYQPALFAVLAMSAASMIVAGNLTAETAKLYVLGLPVLLAGTWVGLRLYGKLDDAAFRKVILVLLLISGAALIVPMR